MDPTVVVSALTGAGLAAANVALSLALLRRWLGLPARQFVGRVLGSLGLRMTGLLAIVLLLLWLTALDPLVFGLAFVIAVVGGLVVEMWIVLRWTKSVA